MRWPKDVMINLNTLINNQDDQQMWQSNDSSADKGCCAGLRTPPFHTSGVPLLSHKDPFLLPYFQAHLHFSHGFTSDTQSSQILPLFDDLHPAKISLSVKVGFALSSVGSGWVWLPGACGLEHFASTKFQGGHPHTRWNPSRSQNIHVPLALTSFEAKTWEDPNRTGKGPPS